MPKAQNFKLPKKSKQDTIDLIHLGAYVGDLKLVHSSVSEGVPKKELGKAFITAAQRGHTNVVTYLAGAGANINTQDPDTKVTALYMAACLNHINVVRALLDLGADKTIKASDGRTPEAKAIHLGYRTLIKIFRAHADKERQDEAELQALIDARTAPAPERI